jgi:hypothetical protein
VNDPNRRLYPWDVDGLYVSASLAAAKLKAQKQTVLKTLQARAAAALNTMRTAEEWIEAGERVDWKEVAKEMKRQLEGVDLEGSSSTWV